MPIITQEQFNEIKGVLKKMQRICSDMVQWRRYSQSLKDILHKPKFPVDFFDKMQEIRSSILFYAVDVNTLALANTYNEICVALKLPQNTLKHIDTNKMQEHTELMDQIRSYAKEVDTYIKHLYQDEKIPFSFEKYWSLLNKICSIDDDTMHKQAKEKFSQTIFYRLTQFHPKVYEETQAALKYDETSDDSPRPGSAAL
ncbi:hypothetical protein FOG18_05245 [Legionella israelensis]|uniref:hypothetical protein n=1 Tax=Legionella israelensis TaxID=454 RepID=UPI00117E41DA|nr:hypothetical protein [Legionella israelensis]QDP72017.1 hypothetical protein FOG18_05245 [Legionella israelensis]